MEGQAKELELHSAGNGESVKHGSDTIVSPVLCSLRIIWAASEKGDGVGQGEEEAKRLRFRSFFLQVFHRTLTILR